MRAFGGITLAVLCLSVGASPAGANPVFDLGSFVPTSISGGQAVGGGILDPLNDAAPPHAGVWVKGTLTRLAEPAGTTASEVSGLNMDGRVSGAVEGTGGVHAVSWDSPTDPVSHQLGPLASLPADYSTTGGVDNAGRVVGTTLETGVRTTGFLAAPGGGLAQVGTFERGPGSSSAVGVTPDGSRLLGRVGGSADSGAADGWYLWPAAGRGRDSTSAGRARLLHPRRAISTLYANNLASDGTVLGYKDGASRSYWLRLPDGSETPVAGLAGHNALTARHVVAGSLATTDKDGNPFPHAAIWKPDGTVVDLNTLLPTGSGLVLAAALAINDNGDIAGIAINTTARSVPDDGRLRGGRRRGRSGRRSRRWRLRHGGRHVHPARRHPGDQRAPRPGHGQLRDPGRGRRAGHHPRLSPAAGHRADRAGRREPARRRARDARWQRRRRCRTGAQGRAPHHHQPGHRPLRERRAGRRRRDLHGAQRAVDRPRCGRHDGGAQRWRRHPDQQCIADGDRRRSPRDRSARCEQRGAGVEAVRSTQRPRLQTLVYGNGGPGIDLSPRARSTPGGCRRSANDDSARRWWRPVLGFEATCRRHPQPVPGGESR